MVGEGMREAIMIVPPLCRLARRHRAQHIPIRLPEICRRCALKERRPRCGFCVLCTRVLRSPDESALRFRPDIANSNRLFGVLVAMRFWVSLPFSFRSFEVFEGFRILRVVDSLLDFQVALEGALG